ncbi:MAG: glycoside hydrolase family 97 C-terminal domain-containing protein, partial [Planctomycetota bacterium]|nr:glycoside hydrolase family 97 C-terminal domain-containing protein [Planctomycetota bacterium]
PENVVSNPAREFLKNLPAAWDDIRFIDGEPGKFAVVARRKGGDWWIAGINADVPREIALKLDFLKEGTYRTTLYHDGKPASPDAGAKDLPFVADPVEINAGKPLTVQMPAGGGFGMVLKDSAKK